MDVMERARQGASAVDIEPLKFLTPEDVRYVAATFGTPAYVYDEATLEANARTMASLPNPYGLTVRYSIKACPSAAIMRLFHRLGLHFDASSLWEVRRAVRAGVEPSRILLTGQEAGQGVFDLVRQGLKFDAGSLAQLEAYGRAFPGGEVSVRFNPGFGSGLVRRLTSGGPESSFGIWHEDVGEVRRLLQRYELGLARVHVHIGSGHDAEVLIDSVSRMLELAGELGGAPVLNLGGGYKVKAWRGDPDYDHHAMADVVAGRLREHAAAGGREMHLEVEPGTYLMANAGSIVARVIDATATGAQGHSFLKLDAGLTEILRPSYYGAPHPLVSVPASGPMREETASYCVAGHCCIAGDMLTTRPGDVEALEPQRLARTEPGDLLVVERAGGYCASMAMKNFNSYPEAPEVLRRSDGAFELIRARQSLAQMVQNERVPADLQ